MKFTYIKQPDFNFKEDSEISRYKDYFTTDLRLFLKRKENQTSVIFYKRFIDPISNEIINVDNLLSKILVDYHRGVLPIYFMNIILWDYFSPKNSDLNKYMWQLYKDRTLSISNYDIAIIKKELIKRYATRKNDFLYNMGEMLTATICMSKVDKRFIHDINIFKNIIKINSKEYERLYHKRHYRMKYLQCPFCKRSVAESIVQEYDYQCVSCDDEHTNEIRKQNKYLNELLQEDQIQLYDDIL